MHLEPWGEGDLPLLQRLNEPAMMLHLGGPETPEKIVERFGRYLRLGNADKDRMFKIVDDTTGEAVGSVGHWDKTWRGEQIYEVGWSVLTQFQGRGIAGCATEQVIALARSDGRHRFVHAFPSIENGASNSICRKLGFTLLEECEFEYPPGHLMRCNDWRLDLVATRF